MDDHGHFSKIIIILLCQCRVDEQTVRQDICKEWLKDVRYSIGQKMSNFTFYARSQQIVTRDYKCIYQFAANDTCNFLVRHEDGLSLANCSQHDCDSKHYKCPGFYCIPWRYLCDKKIDCPGGLDETQCNRSSCPGQFKCMDSDTCISVDSICDNVDDCPSVDDEQFCSPAIPRCPKKCTCLLYALNCQSINQTDYSCGHMKIH